MSRQKSLKTKFKEAGTKNAHFDVYQIDKSNNIITMNVFPGDTGQAALTDAYLDKVKIIDANTGPVNSFSLGTNAHLRSRFLDVYTIVTDIPGPPDLTSFRFQLVGGIADYEYSTEKTVQNQGDSVIYKITIFFDIH